MKRTKWKRANNGVWVVRRDDCYIHVWYNKRLKWVYQIFGVVCTLVCKGYKSRNSAQRNALKRIKEDANVPTIS